MGLLSPLGKCTLRCTKGEVRKDVDYFIVDEDVRPLLGAETCQELNFMKVMVNDIPNSETVNSVNVKCQPKHGVLTEEQILKDYRDVFEGLGCMEGRVTWKSIRPFDQIFTHLERSL